MARRTKKTKFGEPLPGLFDDDPQFAPDPGLGYRGQGGIDPGVLTGGRAIQDTPPAADLQPLVNTTVPDRLDFVSFGSGSAGNSAYIGDATTGILIDAGVAVEHVADTLAEYGIPMTRVKAVILTHDHSDHVRYVYSLVRKYRHIVVCCTPRVLNGALHRHKLSRRLADYHRAIYREHPFNVGAFTITAFETSHDGTDNSGFSIVHGHHNLAVATDMGRVTDRADFYIRQASYLMIEANYDAGMLENGSYPEHLKARIRSEIGHMDNAATAQYLRQIYTPALRFVFLCHLSEDNNTPQIATQACLEALFGAGAKGVGDCSGSPLSREAAVQLLALPRYDATHLLTLR